MLNISLIMLIIMPNQIQSVSQLSMTVLHLKSVSQGPVSVIVVAVANADTHCVPRAQSIKLLFPSFTSL